MNRFLYILVFFSLLSIEVEAQENFHKVYMFQDTFAIFNDVYVTDSCYYYTCTSGKAYQREFFNFGKIHLDGTEEVQLLNIDNSSLQRVEFSRSDMDTNFRGNFVTCYTNSSALGTVPRIKEIDRNGDLISDFTLNNYWQNDSLFFENFSRIQINNLDSSYYLFYYEYDYTTDDNSGNNNGSLGTMLINLKYDGTLIWEKKYRFLPMGLYKPFWYVLNLINLSNSELLLIIGEFKQNSPSNAEMDWFKIHFIKVDEFGNELSHDIFQENQYCSGGYAAKVLPDGGILLSYHESVLTGVPPNGDYFVTRPVIARLDNNYDLIWKRNLQNSYENDFPYYLNMNDVKIVDDSLFVGAYNFSNAIAPNGSYFTNSARLSQYNLDGVNKWNRDYIYFPTDNFYDAFYGIADLELTNDGGYIMVGEAYNYDSLNVGAPGQFGYVLKTNCLGFLGDPQAQFSYSVNNTEVTFVNESVQAGSFTWIFGNGDTTVTGETVDTLVYQYTIGGNYAIQLIANGCNNAHDTIQFSIDVVDDNIGFTGDGTLLTLFPNPVASGESLAFYVGAIPEGNTFVEITNELGEIVFKGSINGENTTYIVPVDIAVGVYFVSLLSYGERLEVEKLVVR